MGGGPIFTHHPGPRTRLIRHCKKRCKESKGKRRKYLRENRQRESRLQDLRRSSEERLESETPEQQAERLGVLSQNAAKGSNMSFQEEHVDSREEYLHQWGWRDTENHLHKQERVRNEMGSFHSSQEMLEHLQCTICKETWPTKENLSKDPARYVYHRCTRDKKLPKVYSAENDMDPGIVPPQLAGLTQIEEMLIARVCRIMSVYRKHGGQGLQGTCF